LHFLDLFFGSEPVLNIMAVLSSALLVQLVCATANLVFKVERG